MQYESLPRVEEIIEKCRCDLRQQMSRSNNDLISLFLVCLCGKICTGLCVLFFFSFYMYRPSYCGLWLPDINKDRLIATQEPAMK